MMATVLIFIKERMMFISKTKICKIVLASVAAMFAVVNGASASELDLLIPSLSQATYSVFGYSVTGSELLIGGMVICLLGMCFGLGEFFSIKRLPAHESMLKVSETIYATCTTYMKQQAKLLFVLELFIGACIVYYFAIFAI